MKLPVGKYARTPYTFDSIGMRVYCAEELCYIVSRQATAISRELPNKRLVKWIGDALGLTELAGSLNALLKDREPAGAFAAQILHYVGFYDEGTALAVEGAYDATENADADTSRKYRIDAIARSGRYAQALVEYDALLDTLEAGTALYAKTLENMGSVFARLSMYSEAADYILQAYDMQPERATLMKYLAAKQLQLGDDGFARFLLEHPEYHNVSIDLTNRIGNLTKMWGDSRQHGDLEQLKETMRDNTTTARVALRGLVDSLCEDYREGLMS